MSKPLSGRSKQYTHRNKILVLNHFYLQPISYRDKILLAKYFYPWDTQPCLLTFIAGSKNSTIFLEDPAPASTTGYIMFSQSKPPTGFGIAADLPALYLPSRFR